MPSPDSPVMSPAERRRHILAQRRHTIPVVEAVFLLDSEQEALTKAQTAENCPVDDIQRGSGECRCEICGFHYRQHPRANPHWYLTVLCSGHVVKL